MRRVIALAAATAALAFAAVPVRAEGEKTYSFPERETWKVGDVATHTETSHKVQRQLVKSPDGTVMQDQSAEENVAYEAVLACREVNQAGDYTKAVVFFKSWSRTVGGQKDESLAGMHVELSGPPTGRTVRVLAADAKVSPEAASWLDEELGKGARRESESGKVFLPENPVAVGASWSPPFAVLAKAFDGGGLQFDEAKSSAKLTLKAVEDGVATLDIDFQMQTKGLPAGPEPVAWSEGGVFSIKGVGRKAIEAGDHRNDHTLTVTFQGSAPVQGGPIVTISVTQEGGSKTVAGGEMPAVPGEDDADPK